MPGGRISEKEWQTRKERVDPRIEAAGWQVMPAGTPVPAGPHPPSALVEYPTENGPADYVLWSKGRVLGVVEAKRVGLSPQNVLDQAERYSRGATDCPFNFDGFHLPFLYSTNGEVIWYRDARHPMNRSRKIAHFHTPQALEELLENNWDSSVMTCMTDGWSGDLNNTITLMI